MEHAYLVRYGLMCHVGRFSADANGYARGQSVVIQSHRGLELGEVLVELPAHGVGEIAPRTARLLRLASTADLARAREVEQERPQRLSACERVFQEGVWPLQLIDVEPLLDGSRTVLHYLGPHHLDDLGLLAALRETCGLDVLLQPAGRDEPVANEEPGGGCGHCGSGGGCGTEGGGCGAGGSHAGGCSGCSIKELLQKAGR